MKPKILIAEDELGIRDSYNHVLNPNYQVISVRDGYYAVKELIKVPDISLLITDNLMTRLNGDDLAKIIKGRITGDKMSELLSLFFQKDVEKYKRFVEQYKNLPIVMISSYTHKSTLLNAWGVNECLTKPVKEDLLLSTVKKYINS